MFVPRRQRYLSEHARATAFPSSPRSAFLLARKLHDVVKSVGEFQMQAAVFIASLAVTF
jgi:hypothetical protein